MASGSVNSNRIVPSVASLPGKSSPKAAPPALTVTVADFATVPPDPLQVNVKVVVDEVSVPVVALPLTGLLPLQALFAGVAPAVQPVAFVVLHVKVEAAPLAIAAGFALNESVGAGGGGGGGVVVTATVADLETLPPLPEQLRENVLVAVRAPVETFVPETCLLPLHALLAGEALAVQFVAFVVVHESDDVPPLATETGLALNDSVGWGGGGGVLATPTVTDAVAVPPAPVQLSEYALLVVSVPVD